MKKLEALLGTVLLLGFGLVGCVKDTCNAKVGNTFNQIEIDSLALNETGLTLNFKSSTLADLPAEYFNNSSSLDSVTESQTTIECTPNTIEILLKKEYLPEIDSTKNYMFTYRFEDRRNYLNCNHAGSNDSYLLLMNFDLEGIDSSSYSMSNFEWVEFFLAGYF